MYNNNGSNQVKEKIHRSEENIWELVRNSLKASKAVRWG